MTEQELEELLRKAGPGYRAGVEPPLDRMWQGIEARAFGGVKIPAPKARTWPRVLALAATLVLGVGLGWGAARLSPPPAGSPPGQSAADPAVVPASSPSPSPFVGVARDYFQQTTGLVVALAGDLRTGRVWPGTRARARELLSTTRLLLDGNLPDPAQRELLEDLELVLAQVVQLPDARQPNADADLIVQAMDQRDVLSRLAVIISDPATAP